VIINDVSDSYQQIYVIAHIICNHLVYARKAHSQMTLLLLSIYSQLHDMPSLINQTSRTP